jgi:hypothetical protein
MDELDLKTRKFEALSRTEITVDEILARLRPIMHCYRVVGTLCFPPLSIYRARRASGFPCWNQVRDLSYPKSGSGFDQRANRKGVKIFYGVSSADLALAEIDVKLGDYVVISDWEITAPLLAQIVGMAGIPTQLVPTDERNIKFTEFLKRNFYRSTARSWPIAISVFFLCGINDRRRPGQQYPSVADAVQALRYPSAKQPNLGENFAIQGSFADSAMRVTRVELFYIDPAKTEGNPLMRGDTFVDGVIEWEPINSGSSDVGRPASDSSSGSVLG